MSDGLAPGNTGGPDDVARHPDGSVMTRAEVEERLDQLAQGTAEAVAKDKSEYLKGEGGGKGGDLGDIDFSPLAAPGVPKEVRRYYDESALRRIELIRRMLKSGYTLQALRELFPWES